MVTPKKEQIIERAKELWHNDRVKNGDPSFDIEPELSELRESGWLSVAQSELMQSEGYLYDAELEASRKTYLEHAYKPNMGKYPLDLKECKKSNVLISGTNQQGKSLLAMAISDLLMANNWQIIVFDNVGHWREKSSIRNSYVVKKRKDRIALKIGESIVLDISLMIPKNQRRFVSQILRQLWDFRILQKPSKWLMIVFEELQLYARNVRGNDAQNILRIMSVGANHKVRCLGISPDLSLIDCAFIRLCQQRYHFRLGNEPNAKRRFRSYYGLDWNRIAQELDVGFAIYVNKDKLQVWKIPMFQKERFLSEGIVHTEQKLTRRNKPK
jgi:hypothetical protein